MPLRFIRVPRVNSQDVLHIAVSTTSLMRELSSMSFFPPATAAVSTVLLILQTLQGVQNNKEACLRLVRRCARILFDINDQMVGRWDTAPPTLTKNLERFQQTLTSIHEFMKILTDINWARRFIKKTSIESSIIEYSAQLEDAAQAFQIATLIDIHYAVSTRTTHDKEFRVTPPPPTPSPPPYTWGSAEPPIAATRKEDSILSLAKPPIDAHSGRCGSISSGESTFVDEPGVEQPFYDHIISEETLEPHGFRRYHQSEVRLTGKSNLKIGWWAGASAAEIEGRSALIKRYEGSSEYALKTWLNDVKLLQNVFHPSLPQMMGFSDEGAPTPFILLSNVRTRSPQSLLLHTLKTRGLAACAHLILQFYQDVMDATLYIQHQKGLDNRQAQDFIDNAAVRVDSSNTVILGLPPPTDGWITVRSYGLTESLKKVVIGMLPNRATIEYKQGNHPDDEDLNQQLSHLLTVTNGLLPVDDGPMSLSSRAQALIGIHSDGDHLESTLRPRLSLRQIRLSNLEANTHNHAWMENSGIPPHKFSVGDLGYIPNGKDFTDFMLLGNVLNEGFEVQSHAHGAQWSWKDFPVRHIGMEPLPIPGDATCWGVAVPPNAQIDCQITHSTAFTNVTDAWRHLLLEGKNLAVKHEITPEKLILITHTGTNQDFYIRDFASHSHFGVESVHRSQGYQKFPQQLPFFQNHPGWNQSQPQLRMLPQQNNLPSMMYLLTSMSPTFEPYWSHSPIFKQDGVSRPSLKSGWTYKIGWCTGFINWIQLHPEDFTD